MDEAIPRSRARNLLASIDKTFGDEGKEVDKLLIALRAAYGDGMERAAGIAMHVEQFGDGSNGEFIAAQITIRDAILQAAGEVTGHAAVLADAERRGMERAAGIAEEVMEYRDSSNGAFISAQLQIAAQIRRQAQEVNNNASR